MINRSISRQLCGLFVYFANSIPPMNRCAIVNCPFHGHVTRPSETAEITERRIGGRKAHRSDQEIPGTLLRKFVCDGVPFDC